MESINSSNFHRKPLLALAISLVMLAYYIAGFIVGVEGNFAGAVFEMGWAIFWLLMIGMPVLCFFRLRHDKRWWLVLLVWALIVALIILHGNYII